MNDDRSPRAFAYCRASTKKQVESPETQREMIQKYAVFNNLGDVTFFVDLATSGKVAWEDRDAGRELVCQIRKGDHVIITKLDRAFRRLADCVVMLEKFESMGVKLHVVNMLGGAIDLSSPMGRFLIHILAAFAELERAFISERTKDGLKNRKAKGFAHSRFPGYGFRWEARKVGGKKVSVKVRDDDERAVMRSILAWRTQEPPLAWNEIRQHLESTLNVKTRGGGLWDQNRIRRACNAERQLQIQEQRGDR